MGISASSLLDDHRSTFITGQAEAELKEFSPYYRKQFSVARLSQVEDELEQQKASTTQLLRQREAPEAGEVLYEEEVLYFDDARKWRERYVVVRANYCLECHESLETFVKGVSPREKLLPTGGTVLTTEEKYMSMVNKCFPDKTSVNEDFAPPLSGMPGQFPVYLRLPYRRDSYFCFRQQAKQEAFLSILSDCIRHQNQDFLKKKTCEVQAFLKAIQLYRQDKGRYEGWDMLIGSDVRVMANVVMEQLLLSLEKDMLPGLKAKKTEKKRVWFATVEAAYILVQEHLLEGLSALKEECRTAVRQQEVLIHSDMDQILSSRRQLGEKVKAKVSEAAEKLCSESVQPYLGSVLEELMEPISSGFQEGRQLSENMMDRCQDVLLGEDKEELKRVLFVMSRPNLLSCYQKIGSLQEKLKHLQERFSFSNIPGVIHSAQIDLQLLMENAAYTFEQLLHKAVQDHPDNPVHAGSALEKSKHRVLKQYDYDSSTVRKRIFQETLVSITLPFLKKSLAPTCRTELRDLEQLIDPDHSSFIHVENVYESVLLQMLDKEVTKVVKEAASLKKYNLFTESRDLVSRSSRSSLSSPAVSTPGSPAMSLASPARSSSEPPPPSPLAFNGLSSIPQRDEKEEAETDAPQSVALMDVTLTETPLDRVAQSEKETPAPRAEEVQTVKAPADVPVQPETTALKDTSAQNETQDVRVAPETVIPQEVISVQTQKVEPAAEPTSTDVPEEAGAAAQRLKTDVEEEAAQTEAAEAEPASEGSEASGEADALSPSSPAPLEAPPGGGAAADPPGDVILAMLRNEAKPVSFSETNSLHVSVGSESPPSEVESTEDVRAERSSGDEGSTTSNVPEDDHSPSPVSSEDAPEATSTGPPQTQTEATGAPPSEPVPEEAPVLEMVPVPEGAPVPEETPVPEPVPVPETVPLEEMVPLAEMVPVAEKVPVPEEAPSSPGARALDCIKDIRDLVVEVINVEELVQLYPSGIPKEE